MKHPTLNRNRHAYRIYPTDYQPGSGAYYTARTKRQVLVKLRKLGWDEANVYKDVLRRSDHNSNWIEFWHCQDEWRYYNLHKYFRKQS
jgi:hypothetical protein